MQKLYSFLALLASLALLVLAVLLMAWVLAVKTAPLPANKIVLIEKGHGLRGISEQLEAEGVVASRYIFQGVAVVTGMNKKLQAGEYEFKAHENVLSILKRMADGDVYHRQITIPEGLTVIQIIKRLKANADLTGDIVTTPLEGSLLPDTYAYTGHEKREVILKRMADGMSQLKAELWDGKPHPDYLKNWNEVLTLASIIEKETGVAAERRRVAGVFVNRLRQGMKLQTDPTVIYGLTMGDMAAGGQGPLGRRLLLKDLETPSPYNTYIIDGLPPTPIANPGRASIEAALNPEPHQFLYFVADGSGGHVFAATLEAHNANVANWRQLRKAAGQ